RRSRYPHALPSGAGGLFVLSGRHGGAAARKLSPRAACRGPQGLSLAPRSQGRLGLGDERARRCARQCARHALSLRAGGEAGTSRSARLGGARRHAGRAPRNGRRARRGRLHTQLRPAMVEPDPKLLEILVCPLTKTTLVYDRERQELVSKAAGLAYPIRGGVPIMLPGEARELSEAERLAR